MSSQHTYHSVINSVMKHIIVMTEIHMTMKLLYTSLKTRTHDTYSRTHNTEFNDKSGLQPLQGYGCKNPHTNPNTR